jgi:hypothetical protein
MTTSSPGHGTRAHIGHRFHFWPTTPLGWWAVGLAVASIVLVPSWKLMGPAGAFPGLSCGAAGGVVALTAMYRRKERAITVIACLVPFLFVVSFVIGELATIGHS